MQKVLWVERIRLCNSLMFVLGLLFSVNAYTGDYDEIGQELANQAKIHNRASVDFDPLANKHMGHQKAEAKILFENLNTDMQAMLPESNPGNIPDQDTLIFASFSLGEKGLKQVFDGAAEHLNSVVIFRGIVNEQNFQDSIARIQKLAAAYDPVVRAVIDPKRFQKYQISSVPTIVRLDKQEIETGRVSGISSPGWLIRKRSEDDKKIDYGVRGPVEEILERDLREIMQERYAKIDWDRKKKKAVERFWTKQTFVDLPTASVPRFREHDPTIYITNDIVDAEGQIIVPMGTEINPLKVRPFTQAVIVFNPLEDKQLQLVKSRVKNLKEAYPRVTFIVTRLDVSDGWKSYKEITDQVDAPIFKLTPEIVSSFALQKTPSIITSKGPVFLIEELANTEDLQ